MQITRNAEEMAGLQQKYATRLSDLLAVALMDGIELSIVGSENPRQDIPEHWVTRSIVVPVPLTIVDDKLLEPLGVQAMSYLMKSDADTVIGQYIPEQWNTDTAEAIDYSKRRQSDLEIAAGVRERHVEDNTDLGTVVDPSVPVEVVMDNGLKITDLVVGEGQEAQNGFMVSVHYTGWLQNPDGTKGKQFDSSYNRHDPFELALGNGLVIQGWDLGIVGMRIGGKRVLVIPPDLAYGNRGAGNVVPPGATLVFEIELLHFY